jgi:signal transduction histidine kinase
VEYGDTRFVTSIPDSLWVMAHDSYELALSELLDRAAHSGEGVEVTVQLTEGDDVATLRVAHDGSGLESVELDALNAGAESDLRHTTGLGLWFVRWMAINSGGSFEISDNDPGTVVELTLPLADPPAQ